MILVTGGTGLIGSHLLYELVRQNNSIRAIKRPNSETGNVLKIFGYYSDNAASLFNKIEWVDADLTDFLSLKEAVGNSDKVYHCAGLVSFDRRIKRKIIDTNVTGTSHVVNICLENDIKKLCFVSSIASFGEFDGTNPVDENTRWKSGEKSSVYSISKLKAELEVWRGIAEGLNAVIVNPSVVFGPGFWNSGVGKLVDRVNKGLRYYTFGTTGYVDARDVARIMVQLMESDISGEQFLLSSENLSFKEVLDIIADSLGSKKPDIYANKLLTGIGWKIEKLKSLFTGQPPEITRDSAKIAHKCNLYSGSKIQKKLNYKFISVKESLTFLAEKYLQERR